jgi:hypothetical protein
MSPPATHGASIKTPGGVKHHLIWISTIHKIFKKGIDQNRQIRHQKGADAIRTFFCKKEDYLNYRKQAFDRLHALNDILIDSITSATNRYLDALMVF